MSSASGFIYGKLPNMTSFFSSAYLFIFLPLCILFYCITPKNLKKYFLLISSVGFFGLISGVLTIYLIVAVVLMYFFGIWIEKLQLRRNEILSTCERNERKAVKRRFLIKSRKVLVLASILLIGTLIVLKYTAFFNHNINSLLCSANINLRFPIPKFLMPVGISFYTLQAVSYLFDAYRETIKPDRNIFRLALFLSFFPQIVEGPICRYSQTAAQLWDAKAITYENLTFGLQRILYGMMKKIVVADRLNPLIRTVFNYPQNYSGSFIFFSAVCYTVQLYMDFSGTMDAVIGTAQIFGIDMPENFMRPFFSKNISEFWKRWHITLGTWFKDYIFYPVTMSKPLKRLTSSARKKLGNHFGPLIAGSIALFCVWICNGLWHGAAWNYIFFGMYHLTFILIGNIIAPSVVKINKKLHIRSESRAYKFMQIIRTSIIVVIGELFFRANGLKNGLFMFKRIITDFGFPTLTKRFLKPLGVDVKDLIIVGVTLIIVFIISVLNENGIEIRKTLKKRSIALRWALLYALILYIVIFGAYGIGYIPVDPMYANF